MNDTPQPTLTDLFNYIIAHYGYATAARELQLSQSTLRKIQNGTRRPALKVLHNLLRKWPYPEVETAIITYIRNPERRPPCPGTTSPRPPEYSTPASPPF